MKNRKRLALLALGLTLLLAGCQTAPHAREAQTPSVPIETPSAAPQPTPQAEPGGQDAPSTQPEGGQKKAPLRRSEGGGSVEAAQVEDSVKAILQAGERQVKLAVSAAPPAQANLLTVAPFSLDFETLAAAYLGAYDPGAGQVQWEGSKDGIRKFNLEYGGKSFEGCLGEGIFDVSPLPLPKEGEPVDEQSALSLCQGVLDKLQIGSTQLDSVEQVPTLGTLVTYRLLAEGIPVLCNKSYLNPDDPSAPSISSPTLFFVCTKEGVQTISLNSLREVTGAAEPYQMDQLLSAQDAVAAYNKMLNDEAFGPPCVFTVDEAEMVYYPLPQGGPDGPEQYRLGWLLGMEGYTLEKDPFDGGAEMYFLIYQRVLVDAAGGRVISH